MVRQKVQESMKRVWRSGPPPHIGWWMANASKVPSMWRWWDGSSWGASVHWCQTSEYAAERSEIKSFTGPTILWTSYYPRNARVPRINPKDSQ